MNKTFTRTSGLRPSRSVFNLSYEKKFTCDMAELIPILCDEVVPGDILEIGSEQLIRFQPMLAPILHEVNVYTHYFFVPYRLLWDEWEDFITGGVDGDLTPTLPVFAPPTDWATDTAKGTLWDYFGFPVGLTSDPGVSPMVFPWNAFNFIYNEFYRDETLIDEVVLDNNNVLFRAWEKDYFTSALPFQQRGTAPAIPLSGTTSAVFEDGGSAGGIEAQFTLNAPSGFPALTTNTATAANRNTIDLSTAETFNVADLRLAFQIQKWLERNARAGARYTEFLLSHFGVAPRDSRLDRPEYIGGSKVPCIVSEVLQTSGTAGDTGYTDTPQGNLAGHGIVVDRKFAGKYRAEEYGLVMGIMSVMPRSAYQQGINRQWLRRTKYDFFFPEFANLSEQAVENAEIYVTDGDSAVNTSLFGYQGRFDEMRFKPNLVCSEMRDTFDYWHLARKFDALPTLSPEFINCDVEAEGLKRIFAVQDEDTLIVNFANIVKAIRPLPIASDPGLIDHH